MIWIQCVTLAFTVHSAVLCEPHSEALIKYQYSNLNSTNPAMGYVADLWSTAGPACQNGPFPCTGHGSCGQGPNACLPYSRYDISSMYYRRYLEACTVLHRQCLIIYRSDKQIYTFKYQNNVRFAGKMVLIAKLICLIYCMYTKFYTFKYLNIGQVRFWLPNRSAW